MGFALVEIGVELAAAAEVPAAIAAADAALSATAVFSTASLGKFALQFVASQALSSLFAAKPESAGVEAAQTGVLINDVSNYAGIPVLYGARRIPGIRILTETSVGSLGEANAYLHVVIVWGEGPIDAITQLYLNDVPIDDAQFAGYQTYTNHLGADTQAADAALVGYLPGKWSSTDTLSGIAYTRVTLLANPSVFSRGLPTITADVRGMPLYDPRTGLTVYSNNPALVLRDYLTNTRYGLKAPSAMIDDAAFIVAANHCDERITPPSHSTAFTADPVGDQLSLAGVDSFSTGMGVRLTSTGTLPAPLAAATTYYWSFLPNWNPSGTAIVSRGRLATSFANAQAGVYIDITDAGTGVHTVSFYDMQRYTCDGMIDIDATRQDNIRAILSSCRGFLVFSGGQYKLKNDKLDSAVSFTLNEDNIVGGWKVALPTKRGHVNRVRAAFIDANNLYQPNVAIQDAPAYRAADGNTLLEQQIDLPLTLDGVRAGQIAQQVLAQGRFGIVCQLTATLAALQLEVGDVVPVTHSTPGWVSQLFRVVLAKPMGSDEIEFTLAQYSASVYTLSTLPYVNPPPATNLPNPAIVVAPGGPSVVETLYQTTGSAGVKSKVTVSWTASADMFVQNGGSYQVEYLAPGASTYKVAAVVNAGLTTCDIFDLAAGVYSFRLKAFNVAGYPSAYSPVTPKELLGLTAAPSNLTGFGLTPFGAQAQLSWDRMTQNTDLDVLIGGTIQVRWSPKISGAVWNDGIAIAISPGDSTGAVVALLTGTYMARAFDSSGNQSAGIVSIITTAADVLNYNAVATLTEDPAFTGAKSSTVTVSGMLQLDGGVLIDSMLDPIDTWGYIDSAYGVASSGTYDFSTYIDLGAVYDSQITAALKTLSVDTNDLIDSRLNNIDDWGLIDGPEISDVNARLYIAATNDDPAGAPTWSSWNPFLVGNYKGRAFKFRLTLTSTNLNHNIEVINLGVRIDMPDREDGARNIASGAATKTVSYTLSPGFKALPKIGITAKNMATGDYFVINNELVTSFDVTFKNAAGTAVDRTFDWRAKGY